MKRFTPAVLVAGAILMFGPTLFRSGAGQALEATGQHRGYTNDQLFLRLDDGKEMTFLVQIPGDTTWKWHKEFATLSRITVTYETRPNEKLPVAIAIQKAAESPKR